MATVRDLVVTEAELGLAAFAQPSGEVLILPAYLCTADDGSRWSLLAITDSYVRFQPPTSPVVSSRIRSNCPNTWSIGTDSVHFIPSASGLTCGLAASPRETAPTVVDLCRPRRCTESRGAALSRAVLDEIAGDWLT